MTKGEEATTSKVNECKTRRTTTKGSITRIKTHIEKNEATITLPELDSLLPESATDSQKRGELEELYVTTKSKILALITDRRKAQAPDVEDIHNQTMYISAPASKSLGKLKLPKFSGKYTEYQNFIQQFTSRVDNDKSMSTIDKFTYLEDCLVGDAKLVIKSLDIVAENYTKALQMMKDRYDNKSIIIQSHIRQIFELPNVTKNSATQLRHLVDSIDGHVRALSSLGNDNDIMNALLLHVVISKLDSESLSRWEDSLDLQQLPKWSDCSTFMSKRSQHLENRDVALKANHHHDQSFKRTNTSSKLNKSTSLTVSQSQCSYCKQNSHNINQCRKFLELPVMNRYNEVRKLMLCINCLSPGHSVKQCRSSRCKVCTKLHHTLLHRFINISSQLQPATSLPAASSNSTSTHNQESTQTQKVTHSSLIVNEKSSEKEIGVLLATAVIKIKSNTGSYVPIRVLLDSASQLNFITQCAAQKLGLKRRKICEIINGIGDVNSRIRHKTSATIKSASTNYETNIDLWILPSITTTQPEVKVDIRNWKIPDRLTLADSNFSEPQRVDMLIGAEIFFDLLLVGRIKLGDGLPTLVNTLFGWIVSGNYKLKENQRVLNSLIITTPDNDTNSLNEVMQKFWQIEEVESQNNHFTDEQLQCESFFKETVLQQDDGWLMVRLPFRSDPVILGDSFKMAQRRFLNLEKRLVNHDELKCQHIEFMREYEKLGHMEVVQADEIPLIRYLMPHQCVIRPDSSTTKLRVVFDASARTSSNVSLNDVLMMGPTVQDDLFAIILRFRSYAFALTADISKMYRQFLVHPDDRHFQCILWRERTDEELKAYRLNTLTYGTSPAPYLATRCLNHVADQNIIDFPLGAHKIKNDFYVDDLISGADTRSEIFDIRAQIEAIFRQANLELRKWFSNDAIFLNEIPVQEREKTRRIDEVDIINTLGVIWEPAADEFRFIATITDSNSKITKRSVLSDLAKLFDPLGLVNPVIVLAKIFMQRLWILKLEWDELIPEDLAAQWRLYRSQLANLKNAHIYRRIFSSNMVQCELHGFADASLRAYGCCVYTRCTDSDGNIIVRLVGAKSKVAPVSTESLPKLELNAAVLLAKLLHRITTSLNKQVDKIYLWTDSEIVLDWISDHPSSWEVYIANRVSTIQKLTINASWRHVNSKANPADIISRGSLADELLKSMWFTGPDFLLKSEEFWPITKARKLKENIPGRRKLKGVFVSTISNNIDMIQHHKYINDFAKLRRVFAHCIRFFKNVRSKLKNEQQSFGPLSARELDDSLLRLVWYIQHQYFAEEINIIEKQQQQSKESWNSKINIDIPKYSRIKSLNPFIDDASIVNLLKVGGRLQNSDLPDISKFPILIPKNHPFALSYISYLHSQNFHAGAQALVSIARQRFWIIDIRHIARKVVHNCIRCFKAKPKLLEQIMGPLPASRVRPARPFWNSGVDFCGPLYITQRIRHRGPTKAYVAVFICFVTKAVHLEVVSNLSTDSFIASLKRFIARRGICRNLYCDNATNFVGARNEMMEFSKMFHSKESTNQIARCCSEMHIEFHHIPPRAPHFGGLWEAAVKSAKHLLIRTIGQKLLTFEELTTIITQIEAVLNSRPITAMSADPNDESALTPGHFLIGTPLNALAEPDVSQVKFTLLDRWQQVQALQQMFWKRWREEYVSQLQQRQKWNSSSPNVKVGTLVLIHEDNVPPQNWLLGRIVEVIQGQDGHVRVINVKTKNGILKRAINKVAPLPVEDF